VLGNCVSNIVDGVVWELKLVAQSVDELAITLFLRIFEGGHRREGGRGGRLSWGITGGTSGCGRRRLGGGSSDRPFQEGARRDSCRSHCVYIGPEFFVEGNN